jgi:hypothetical protein
MGVLTMAQDSYTEVRTQSWFSRIRDSFIGVLLGLLLFTASFLVLWYNEGRSVKTAAALREVQETVLPLTDTEVSAQNEGKLIYVTGTAKTPETIIDETLGISANAMKLIREVEMYQWVESSKSESKEKIGGGKETVTTYTYETKWSGSTQDSAQFKKTEGHVNPAMTYTNATFTAKNVTLGSFLLTSGLIDKINLADSLLLQNADLNKIPAPARSKAKLADGYLYLGNQGKPEPITPRVGDYRIRYRVVPAEITLSIISKQIANTFEPYRAKNGRLMELVETGTVSADTMVENAQKSNQLVTWLLRLLGFVLMFAGLMLCFKPLSIFAAVIPVLGRIVGAGSGLVAFMLALAFSLITIAIAWIVYRPLLAVILITGAIFAVYLAIKSRKKPGMTKSL